MNTKLLVLCIVLFAAVFASDEPVHMRRRRLRVERQMGMNKMTEEHYNRRTQSAPWRPLKIFFDTTSLMSDLRSQGSSNRVAFYTKVFDITGEWWSGALQVNDARSEIAPQINSYKSRYTRELGFDMGGKSASSYDLLVRVFLCADNGNALAYAGPFLRHPTSQRPITGTVCILPYGDANFKKAKDSVNRAVGTVIHEFGHVISFISFQNYQNKNIVLDRSINRFKWIGPKVKSVCNKYYACSDCQGVPLQNNNGQLGGHWSETFLSDELMTPTTGADPELVSPMTLALCEDSGWYKADYRFTENYSHKKAKGCTFTKSCGDQICTPNSSGFVTSDFKGVGYCSTDANNCAQEKKYSNRDCMNGSKWPSSLIDYGASYGGNCAIVKGTFKRKSGGYIYSQSLVSAQTQCSNSKNSYTITFKNFAVNSSGRTTGDANVLCTTAGTKSFNTSSTYPSSVTCVDPVKLCRARFGKIGGAKCDDTCSQNGRCQRVGGSSTSFRNRRMELSSWKSGWNRKLQAAPCPSTGTKPSGSGSTKPTTTRPPFGTSSSGSTWQCWCYSDGQRKTACPSLPEDRDGEGY